MTTYATNNPRGSMDPKDLFDNAQNLDFAVNDITKAIWKDRFGRDRKTYWGMEQEFSAQLLSQKQTGEAQLQNQKEELDAQVLSQEQRFSYFIMNSGYKFVGEYTDGPLTITEYNQLIRYQNEFYKLTAATTLPFTTTGNDATSWANDSLHFVSVGDAALRQNLSAPGGAGLVGFQQGSAGSAAITVEGKLRERISVKDFGGKSGFTYDSSDALVAFINAINSGAHEGSEFLIDGLYRTTKPLPAITKPVTLKGVIQANSAILFDNVLDGIKLDHSSLTDATVHSYVGYFSVLTNKTIAGTGFKYIPNSSGRDASVKLEINSFRVDSLSRFTGSNSSSEWLTGIHIGEASFGFKPSEVRIYNTVVYGSDSNQNYSTLTGTGSSGIIVEKSTNCIIRDAKVFLLDGYGILFRGQSEGCGVYHCAVVAVRKGIFFTGLINPSNNHYISTTHVSPYETGIFVEPPAETPNVSTSIACYFSDIFILERGDSVAKSTRFIGLDVATRFSKMTNITVWANAKTGGIHEKIGFRVACAGNTLVNCHSHNMTYSLETFEVIPGYAYGVELCDFFDENSITGFISPLSLKNPTGSVRTSTKPYDRPLYYADQMTVIHNSGVPIFDVNAGTVSNRSPTGNVTNYNHIPNNQTVAGAQLVGLGGTDTPNSGNWNILSALALFSGDIRPSTPNTKLVGTPGAPWAGGNTQTAFNVTSDERYKTPSKSITDAMLDAWAEVEWIQYQYLDRVEAKGIDGARWHYGVIAQRTMEAFARHGLDASKYGFLCHDEWEATDEVVDEFGHIITPALAAGDRYGIRYEEALALEAALQRRNYERLLARIEALENK